MTGHTSLLNTAATHPLKTQHPQEFKRRVALMVEEKRAAGEVV